MNFTTLRTGSRRLAAAAALVLVPAALPAQELPAAADLFAAYNKAIGGEAAFANAKGSRSAGSFAMPAMGMSGTLEVFSAPPSKTLVVINLPGFGELRQGYDGETAWAMDPMQGPRVLAGAELSQMVDRARWDSALRLMDRFQSAETVEKTEMGGQACYRVKLVWKDGRESTECFSVENGLMVGSTAKAETPMGVMEATSLISDYKQFGDFLMPTKTVTQSMGAEQVLTIDTVEFVEVEAAKFELPAEIKALKN
jgi:hypothetical protein